MASFPFFLATNRTGAGRRRFRPSYLNLEFLESRLTPTSAYDPNSLLIRFNPNYANPLPAANGSVLPGVILDYAYDLVPGLWRARIEGDLFTVSSAIAALSSDPRVEYAVPNGRNQAESIPNDPRFASQWYLAQVGPSIRAVSAWDNYTGSGVTIVAIFDTGVDVNHPDLKNRIWGNGAEIPGDGIDNDGNGIVDDFHGASFNQGNVTGDVLDGDGHGTAVAGLIGATGNNGVGVAGVNWSATILPLKVIQAGQALDGDLLQAMDYAAKAGAKIWNLSLGGGAYSRAMSDAFDAASNRGIIVVSAAGNNSQNNDINPHFPSSYTAENVIAVAATDANDRLARFSNFGIASVDIAAPGTNLLTTLPGGNYGTRQGTSMAAALVSGALSLLWDRSPNASASQVLDALMNHAKSLDSLKGVVQAGGRLDIGGLTQEVVDARPPVPPASGGSGSSGSVSNPGGSLPGTVPSVPDNYNDSGPGSLSNPLPSLPGKPILTPPVIVSPSLPVVTPINPSKPPVILPNPGTVLFPPVILPDPGGAGPVPPVVPVLNPPVALPPVVDVPPVVILPPPVTETPVPPSIPPVLIPPPSANPQLPVPGKDVLPVEEVPELIDGVLTPVPVTKTPKDEEEPITSPIEVSPVEDPISVDPDDEVWEDYYNWDELDLWDDFRESPLYSIGLLPPIA